AEDGIRDFHVTGVQTCALPISRNDLRGMGLAAASGPDWWSGSATRENRVAGSTTRRRRASPSRGPTGGWRRAEGHRSSATSSPRSEERRVGKGGEQRAAGAPAR